MASHSASSAGWMLARGSAVVGAAALFGGCAAPAGSLGAERADQSDLVPVATLHVRIEGAEANGGPLRAALYRDRASFLARGGLSDGQSLDVPTAAPEFRWEVPAETELVVSIFQDRDADGDLDRGAFGVPAEPWGFSGKPSPFAPPRWSACAIRTVPGENRVTIRLFPPLGDH